MKTTSLHVMITVMLALTSRVTGTIDSTVPADGSLLLLTSPAAGQVLYAGDTMDVRWLANDTVVQLACLWLLWDWQESPYWITDGCLEQGMEAWEHVRWPIPSSFPSPRICRIEYDNYLGGVRDTSAPFAILPPVPPNERDTTLPANGLFLEVLSPVGGENFHCGDTMHIRWRCVDKLMTAVLGEISFDGGRSFHNLAPALNVIGLPGEEGWEHFHWVVPDSVLSSTGEPVPLSTDEAVVRIYDYMQTIADYSDAFTIRPGDDDHTPPAAAIARTTVTSSCDGSLRVGSVAGNRIAVTVGHGGPHTVALYRMNGARVTHRRGTGPAGYTIDKRGLSSGLYCIRVTTGGTTVTRYVTIAR